MSVRDDGWYWVSVSNGPVEIAWYGGGRWCSVAGPDYDWGADDPYYPTVVLYGPLRPSPEVGGNVDLTFVDGPLKCNRCSEVLKRPGALVFGPPNAHSECSKTHLCVACHQKFLVWFADGKVQVES